MGEKGNVAETVAPSLGDRAVGVVTEAVGSATEAAKGLAVGMATARVEEHLATRRRGGEGESGDGDEAGDADTGPGGPGTGG
jgi:hypothetical protein